MNVNLVNSIYLVIDIGTTDIKCGCIDTDGDLVVQQQREFPMTQNRQAFEIDFVRLYDTVDNLITGCLADQAVQQYNVKAILVISQAQTFAPVDADFQPLRKGIVWLDGRAGKEAAYLGKRFPDFARSSGISRPLPEQYVSKLLWIKEHEPVIYRQARHFPLINEYLIYRLTGHFFTDTTTFGMGGLYDFRSLTLHRELLSVLGLTEAAFPVTEKAAGRGESVHKHLREKWHLAHPVPVYACGNDQGASACGAGVKREGDVSINFGTAMVVYTITQSMITHLQENQITGKHPSGDDYYLLHVESDFGMQIKRLKEIFFHEGSYDQLFQTYRDYPDVDEYAPPPGETALKAVMQADAPQLCAGIIKHYVRIFNAHFSSLAKICNLRNIFVSGGMTQSRVWLDIVQSHLKEPVTVTNHVNAGLYGAIEIYKNTNTNKR